MFSKHFDHKVIVLISAVLEALRMRENSGFDKAAFLIKVLCPLI